MRWMHFYFSIHIFSRSFQNRTCLKKNKDYPVEPQYRFENPHGLGTTELDIVWVIWYYCVMVVFRKYLHGDFYIHAVLIFLTQPYYSVAISLATRHSETARVVHEQCVFNVENVLLYKYRIFYRCYFRWWTRYY